MILSGFLPSPFTDFFAIVMPNYRQGLKNDICSKIESRLLNCFEAYGNQKGREKCRDIFYDFFECHHGKIKQQRINAIREERKRKYKAKEIDELFSEKPPLDSYFHI